MGEIETRTHFFSFYIFLILRKVLPTPSPLHRYPTHTLIPANAIMSVAPYSPSPVSNHTSPAPAENHDMTGLIIGSSVGGVSLVSPPMSSSPPSDPGVAIGSCNNLLICLIA